MSYLDILKEKAEEANSILCFGIDPVLEKMPEKDIVNFYSDIFNAMEGEDVSVPSVKPNIAFFEQYGLEGLSSLKKLLEDIKKRDISIILDAKRGDIGTTAKAYAKSVYKVGPNGLHEANYILKHSFFVSCHPSLTKDDMDYIVKVFESYLDEKN